MCGVRAALEAGARLVLVDGGLGHAKALGQAGGTGSAGDDLSSDGAGVVRAFLCRAIIMEALRWYASELVSG